MCHQYWDVGQISFRLFLVLIEIVKFFLFCFFCLFFVFIFFCFVFFWGGGNYTCLQSIETETVFTKTEMINEWNINFLKKNDQNSKSTKIKALFTKTKMNNSLLNTGMSDGSIIHWLCLLQRGKTLLKNGVLWVCIYLTPPL